MIKEQLCIKAGPAIGRGHKKGLCRFITTTFMKRKERKKRSYLLLPDSAAKLLCSRNAWDRERAVGPMSPGLKKKGKKEKERKRDSSPHRYCTGPYQHSCYWPASSHPGPHMACFSDIGKMASLDVSLIQLDHSFKHVLPFWHKPQCKPWVTISFERIECVSMNTDELRSCTMVNVPWDI